MSTFPSTLPPQFPPQSPPRRPNTRHARAPFSRTLTRLLKKHEQVLGVLPPGQDALSLAHELSSNIFFLDPGNREDELAKELEHIQERLQEERRVHILCTADFPHETLRHLKIKLLWISENKEESHV